MKPPKLTILGGGPAGLAVAHYAKQRGVSFQLLEAGEHLGGNCRTLRHKEFRFDTGAHRFHDRLPEITLDVQTLLKDELVTVRAPSFIYDDGTYINFPISPLGLLKHLGAFDFAAAVLEVVLARFRSMGKTERKNFAAYAHYKYGKRIADRFLLNYSEKLWGRPCDELSAAIAGSRLKGLSLRAFLLETLADRDATTEHLEGASFFYPRGGYGAIMEKLAASSGHEQMQLRSPVTEIVAEGSRIVEVGVAHSRRVPVDHVVSTLPVTLVMEMLRPAPPAEVLAVARSLKFRDVVLVALFLNRSSVSEAATLYFPDKCFPFSRICEPRNRCASMAPVGKTSLLVELPCSFEDSVWSRSNEETVRLVVASLENVRLIAPGDLSDSVVHRIRYAYPILDVEAESKMAVLQSYLDRYENLVSTGRNGSFSYTFLHDMLNWGKQIANRYTPCSPISS